MSPRSGTKRSPTDLLRPCLVWSVIHAKLKLCHLHFVQSWALNGNLSLFLAHSFLKNNILWDSLAVLWDIQTGSMWTGTLFSLECEEHSHGNLQMYPCHLVFWCSSICGKQSKVYWKALKWRAEDQAKDSCCTCLQSVRDHESDLDISENKSYRPLKPCYTVRMCQGNLFPTEGILIIVLNYVWMFNILP